MRVIKLGMKRQSKFMSLGVPEAEIQLFSGINGEPMYLVKESKTTQVRELRNQRRSNLMRHGIKENTI